MDSENFICNNHFQVSEQKTQQNEEAKSNEKYKSRSNEIENVN